MQKARIRTGWKNREKQISIKEFANALSAICWRIALNAAKNLHQQDFIYHDDPQRIGVIQAYLHFFIHCADRLMFAYFDQTHDETRRGEFMTALTMDCKRHYMENAKQILGRANVTDSHAASFVDDLNLTMNTLAQWRFSGDQPGYQMRRLLGLQVQDIMGNCQTNKWITDQVMEIDGPQAYEIFRQSFDKLKRASGY